MPQQTNKPEEGKINSKLAVIMIVVSFVVVASLGVAIGKTFFWDKFENSTKLDRELEIALDNVERDPASATYRVALGWTYFQRGELENALTEYQNALRLEPNNSQVKFNLASAYIESGNLAEARSLMEEYVKGNQLHASGHALLGLIYRELGEYDKAIAAYHDSVRISPGNTNVYYQLGIVYEQAGDLVNARKYYQKTLDYNPQFEQAEQKLQSLKNQ